MHGEANMKIPDVSGHRIPLAYSVKVNLLGYTDFIHIKDAMHTLNIFCKRTPSDRRNPMSSAVLSLPLWNQTRFVADE